MSQLKKIRLAPPPKTGEEPLKMQLLRARVEMDPSVAVARLETLVEETEFLCIAHVGAPSAGRSQLTAQLEAYKASLDFWRDEESSKPNE